MDITRNSNTKLHLQTLEPRTSTNPFAEDSLINRINLKEATDFINQSSSSSSNERRQSFSSQKSLGEGRSNNNGQRRVMLMESPCTPGRGVFSFSSNLSGRRRNNFPSKWIDAEKWVTSGYESPAHSLKNSQFDGFKPHVEVVYSEKSKESPQDLVLKDKLPNEVEGFIFKEEEAQVQLQHRDIGTEMTPIASRCNTPFTTLSPARHNTPSKLSGPLTETKNVIDISEFADKLRLSGETVVSQYCYNSVVNSTSHWNSKEEEEEEISKSLRHFDMESELRRSVSESKVALWDDEDNNKIKFCQRYQREEAKIQAWVNLENAKAEAQSRKLEVKIQKMRSNLEEKLMKRMDTVHRRAEDWRATARQQHAEQMQRAAETARKLTNRRGYLVTGRSSCGCLPCNNTCH